MGMESEKEYSRESTLIADDRNENPGGNAKDLERGDATSPSPVPSVNGNEKKEKDEFAVTTLDPSSDPKQFSKPRRWLIVFMISLSAFCVTFDSSAVSPSPSFLASSIFL